ncbi:hypothetical protein [Nocardia sp. NPDC059228]|uniref:hypothetical protein n=1 Tax=Nocardia sp. NPDC059228 TaxID=3346777 RepID=UPI00369C5146
MAIEIPADATPAQIDTARGWLIACADMTAPDAEAAEEAGQWLKSLADEAILRKTLRLWSEGWAHFCAYFADDIAAAEAALGA